MSLAACVAERILTGAETFADLAMPYRAQKQRLLHPPNTTSSEFLHEREHARHTLHRQRPFLVGPWAMLIPARPTPFRGQSFETAARRTRITTAHQARTSQNSRRREGGHISLP